MATAKLVPPAAIVPPPTVTLELSVQEAAIIMKLVGRVGGGHVNRKYTSAVYDALIKLRPVDALQDLINIQFDAFNLTFTGQGI